ncbi:Large neutral amino acids transporter small subunit 2, partial [Stegodyphus mimosarum]
MPIFVALSTFGGVNGNLFTSARFFAMASHEGQLPEVLGMISICRCTPVPSLLLTCFMSLVMLCTSNIYALINYLSFAQWLWTGIVILGLMIMRKTRPHMHRPIRVSLICPVVFLACCVFLTVFPMIAEPVETGIGLAIMLAGLPVYLIFCYKQPKHSRLRGGLYVKITRFLQKLLEVVTP